MTELGGRVYECAHAARAHHVVVEAMTEHCIARPVQVAHRDPKMVAIDPLSKSPLIQHG
jgi:hypothetical protein